MLSFFFLLPENTDAYLLLIIEIQTSTDEINVAQDADLPLLFPQGVSPASKSKPCENVVSAHPTPSLQTPWALSPLPKPTTQSVPGAEAGAELPDCQVIVLLHGAMARPAKSWRQGRWERDGKERTENEERLAGGSVC